MTNSPESASTTPATLGTQPQLLDRLPAWRLILPLLCQTALILAAPAQSFYTLTTGKTVVLQTVPVDPYDFLRGYSQTLSYDISNIENLRQLPGWQEIVKLQAGKDSTNLPVPADPSANFLTPGTSVYAILEAPNSATSSPPKAWKPVRVNSKIPTSLSGNQIALKGTSTGYSIEYGLETYYMPESRRDEINDDISRSRQNTKQSVVVEVKVDSGGRAVPVSFWVRDRHYSF